jgi:redox-sensitive bicupin YhaK (pirin superfamily)
MIRIRKSDQRGHADHGWLKTRYTFSFADYHDPEHMGFRNLRVINEDRIAGGAGFPTHPHRDMEIITYVVSGTVAHRDSSGGEGITRAGEIQHMSAGSGVQHSEFNASKTEPIHLLQIWILPERRGVQPTYNQIALRDVPEAGPLKLVAARDGGDGRLQINADANLFVGQLDGGEKVEHALASRRHAWLQLISGKVALNGQSLEAGDGAALSNEQSLALVAHEPAHFLLFDLA